MSTVNPLKALAGCVSPPPSLKQCEQLLSFAEAGFGLKLGRSDAALDDRVHETFQRLRKNLCSEDFAATATLVEIALALDMQQLAETVLSAFLAAPPDALASATIGQRLRRIADCSQDLSAATHTWWLESACRLLVSIAHLSDGSADIDELNECFLGFLCNDSSLDTLESLSQRIHPAVFYSLVRCWHKVRIAAGHDPYDPLYDSGLHVEQNGEYADVSPQGESWYTSPYPNLRTAFVASLMESSLSDGVLLVRHTNLPFRKIPPGPCQFFAAHMLLQMHANECDSQIAEGYRQGILQRLIFDCLDEHLQLDPRNSCEPYVLAVKAMALALRYNDDMIGDGKHSAMRAGFALGHILQQGENTQVLAAMCVMVPEFSDLLAQAVLGAAGQYFDQSNSPNAITWLRWAIGYFLDDSTLLEKRLLDIEAHTLEQISTSGGFAATQATVQLACVLTTRKTHYPTSEEREAARGVAVRLLKAEIDELRKVTDEQDPLVQMCLSTLRFIEPLPDDKKTDQWLNELKAMPPTFEWASRWWMALLKLRLEGQVAVAEKMASTHFHDMSFVHAKHLGGRDQRIDLASEIVRLSASSRPDFVEELAQAIAEEQDEHYETSSTEGDRDWFLTFSETGRHTVARALSSLPHTEGQEARRRRVAALLWDCRYTGRRLVDRRRYWSPNGQPNVSLPPTGDLIQALGPAALVNSYSSATSMGYATMLSLRDMTLYRAATQKERASGEKSVVQRQSDDAFRPSKPDRTEKEALGTSDEPNVAGLLTDGTVLVKVGFSLAGQLVWAAFRSRDGQLDLVGCDAGNGHATADQTLKEVVAVFDRACADIVCRDKQIGDSLESLLDALAENANDVHEFYASLLEQCVHRDESICSVADAFPILTNEFGHPSEWQNGTRRVPSLNDWVSVWSRLQRMDMNKATEDFLSRAASIIPVDEIATVIEGRDVLFMLEDSLFAIPLSFLRVSSGKRLFEIARSIRTVLSPAVHGQYLQDESQPYAVGQGDQVLCISGVPGRLPDEMVATKRLFEEHSKLATSKEWQNSLIWRGAWDWPRGCHDVMARGIYDAEQAGSRTALLTVLGHGHRDGGVELRSLQDDSGPEYWQAHCVRNVKPESSSEGRGIRPACDLSSVDFLIQVSCSVGRAEQDGLYDVQGFPANLVVAGARSTAAARWPILADEAERFANHLAASYLRRRDQAIRDRIPFKDACIRTLALAETRQWWLETHVGSHAPTGDEFVGLHTAAAFELYGFG